MSARIARTLALAACLSAACDGLGQPVVDRVHMGKADPRECERRRPRCDDVIGAPEAELDVGVMPRSFDGTLPACDLRGQESARRIVGLFRECTLALDASAGEEREIAQSSLDNVLLQLDGRVQLRIVESQLFRVTVESDAAPEPELPAVLQISHSDLRRSAVRAQQVELTSCFLDKMDVEASELSAVDMDSKESFLRATQATISAALLTATRVGGCDSLLLAGNRAINSRFDACTGVTRVYDVEATGCSFDGQIDSDDSTFADGRFGVADATRLHSWGSSIDNTVFCADVDHFRYAAGSIVCSVCQGPLSGTNADACFDNAATTLEANGCKAFEVKKSKLAGGEPQPEICTEFPRHERPIIQL